MIRVPHEMSKTTIEVPTPTITVSNPTGGDSPFNERGGTPVGCDGVCSPKTPAPKTPVANATLPLSKGVFARLKRIRHIERYAAAAVIVVMVLIFFSSLGGKTKSPSTAAPNLTATETNYIREMEDKLTRALADIAGAGSVTVMVTAVGSSTLEIAYNIDEKTVTNTGSGGTSTSTTTVTKTPVIVGGKPLIITEIKPQLSGILVIASGATDLKTRLAIENAIHAVVPDNSVKIQVLTRK